MKRKFYVRCSSLSAAAREGIVFEPVEESDEIENVQSIFGDIPILKYFLESPGALGYGGYGSDYCVTFYILKNGKCVANSPYTGEEEFNSEDKMIDRIKTLKSNMIEECNKLLEDGDISEEEYDSLAQLYE